MGGDDLEPLALRGRFAALSPPAARGLCAAIALLMLACALVPVGTPQAPAGAAFSRWVAAHVGNSDDDAVRAAPPSAPLRQYHTPGMPFSRTEADLALYDEAVANLAQGGHYYDFIVPAQRAIGYPVRPALAFRLPTLAWFSALVGPRALPFFALFLLGGCAFAWTRRAACPQASARERLWMGALVLVGGSLAFNPYYLALHEVWSGLLVALGVALYRPQVRGWRGWLPALCCLALALAVRELVLPAVLLMAAAAVWNAVTAPGCERQYHVRESLAWCLVVALFALALGVHLWLLSRQVLPTDRVGPGWLMLRGLSGWLSDIVMSTPLRFVPHWLAGPVVVVMLLGWAGMRGPKAAIAALMLGGYAFALCIAGRADNFYWGLIVAPLQFAGLALAPRALRDLYRAAIAGPDTVIA